MSRRFLAGILGSLAITMTARAQTSAVPLYATAKVDGTDNVYIFRYAGHQSMFVVTPAGVIATDPISHRRPAAKAYIEEIRKITRAPIRYVIYSHAHYDHIAGGQPFKELGATFVAHRNVQKRLTELAAIGNAQDVVPPDELVDSKKTITLGGTRLELLYVGKNHSDSSLLMKLPKERILFAVDCIPIQTVGFRIMADDFLPDTEEAIAKVLTMNDWDRLIPGHPGANNIQIGTRQDVRDALTYLRDLSAAAKKAFEEGKCYDQAEKEIRLPRYENWAGYGPFLPMNVERYCDFWNRGL